MLNFLKNVVLFILLRSCKEKKKFGLAKWPIGTERMPPKLVDWVQILVRSYQDLKAVFPVSCLTFMVGCKRKLHTWC